MAADQVGELVLLVVPRGFGREVLESGLVDLLVEECPQILDGLLSARSFVMTWTLLAQVFHQGLSLSAIEAGRGSGRGGPQHTPGRAHDEQRQRQSPAESPGPGRSLRRFGASTRGFSRRFVR